MKQFLLKFFTWWNGQTFGTQLWTSRFGELVGEDEQGNRYYRTKGGEVDPTLHFERRWVVYNGYAEASRIPAGWHGWLHHTVDVPPTEQNYQAREWEKPPSAEPDRHRAGLPSVRLDAGERPPPQGNRRLSRLDAGKLTFTHCCSDVVVLTCTRATPRVQRTRPIAQARACEQR
ncbi:NADH:ubiquinone oxidoreductase subunit [Bradyrhizobium elkanii]